jgi:23S rRNA (cytosine1962-C5)-methyltransferase
LWLADPARPAAATEFHLNGLVFHYDANAGQKTGAFLDQRANYAAARDWAQRLGRANPGSRGRALDVCCYQGGFALHLAQVCRQVTGIDSSRASLEVAERNLQANRASLTAEVDWIEADAFEILRDWSQAGETFDAIVLDPPAFAKTKRAVESALRGYKELNLRALKMLGPGGLLITCSCSHHVSWADLEAAVAAAAADASRRVRLLERRGAAPDHPVVLNLPETEYLKCLVLEVE